MEKKLPEEIVSRLKQVYGYTDEQIAGFSPKQRKAHLTEMARADYKMIAEVVKAENCACRPKIGEKYVFWDGGAFLPEESTVKWFCLWAMAPLANLFYVFYDRMAEGLDPAGTIFEYAKCMDTGTACGGWGQVTLKVHWEKAKPQ